MEFRGFTEKQSYIINQPLKRGTVLSGATRSGKTFLSYFLIPLLIDEFGRNSAGIILGKTLGTIEENVLKHMRDIFGVRFISEAKSNASKNTYCYMFGSKVRLVGLNDKSSESKIRGSTYDWAVCDEVTLYPEKAFDMLMSRLSRPNAKWVATTNPDIPEHWFKKRYMDNKSIDISVYNFTIDDNPLLELEYVENLKAMYKGTELYDRFILGLWVSAEGLIYKKFVNESDKFIIDTINSNDIMDVCIGVDFGESKSSTTFVASGIMRNGRTIVVLEDERINEHGDTEKLQEQFVAFCKRCLANGWRVWRAVYDSAQLKLGRSLQSAVIKAGMDIRVEPVIKEPIKDRIVFTQLLLGAYHLLVLSKCKETINALKNASWNTTSTKEERLDVVSETNPVDILDAFEYSWQKWMKNVEKLLLYGGKSGYK